MEKIAIDTIIKYMEAHEIELSPTQQVLCVPIINRIYQKMLHDLAFDDIKVCEGLIIDGHHRYLSSLLAGKVIGNIASHKSSATQTLSWSAVEFVDMEWDTPEKIEKLNKDDAAFNNLTLAEVYEMTK